MLSVNGSSLIVVEENIAVCNVFFCFLFNLPLFCVVRVYHVYHARDESQRKEQRGKRDKQKSRQENQAPAKKLEAGIVFVQ